MKTDPTPRETKEPRYRTISEAIRRDIETRSFSPGERLPPDAQLAVRFDTSRLTVIRALRDLEAEGLVQRRAGSGTFVRSLTGAATRVFGLLMPDLDEGEVFDPICQGIVRAGELLHHRLLWGSAPTSTNNKEQQAEELCHYFISRKVSGVFFAPVELTARQDEVNEKIAADLERASIPTVLIDRCVSKFPRRSRHDLVGIDNRRAGYRMTAHLLKAGCRKVAFAFRPGSAPTVDARHAGYREALWTQGLPSDNTFVFQSDGSDSEALKKFVDSAKPDGIVCANDLTAAKVMHTLLKLGVRIPEDMRMVGINDVKYAQFLPVPLTTLRQPCQEIGAAAMAVMLDRLHRPSAPTRDVLLDCEVIVRQSCGAKV
ncbi:MAG TPA: GntR family transcriptional regulator [Bryobacteraceae bacterium]|nr:GntR family transcriptional regulator [Bryobacteraceae bacterium]